MIKIACLMDKKNGLIAPAFADGRYIYLVDAESLRVLTEFPRRDMTDEALARWIVEEDCEAVITGAIEKEPFGILADEGFITRYKGVGLPLREAVEKMNAYALPMVIDHVGGSGVCNSDEEAEVPVHRHHPLTERED